MASLDKVPYLETVTERFCGLVIISTVRLATEDDIKKCRNLHASGKCDHSIVYDEPGWLYNFRVCFVCGQGLGTV